MKNTAALRPASCRKVSLPNAASRRYFLEKAVDAALSAVLTAAVVAVLLFLFALG